MAASQEEQQDVDAYPGADASNTALVDLAPLDHQKVPSMLAPSDLCTAVQVTAPVSRALGANGEVAAQFATT